MKISDLYYKADQFLVDMGDEAVKAWNWTTGRTRAELADVLNVSGSTLAVGSALLIGDTLWTAIQGVGWGSLTLFNHILNYEQDSLESDEDIKHNGSEINRGRHKSTGPGLLALGGIAISGGSLVSELYGAGAGIFGASSYVMRSDYNPPKRKDCVRRGLDKLAEMTREATSPEPRTVPIQNYSMFKGGNK